MQNYFKIFELQENFLLDKQVLRNKYFALQAKYHPDKFIKSSDDEKANALKISSDLNKGFKILGDDLLRAEHLLEISGVRVNKEANNSFNIPQQILLEQMELRERASDAISEQEKNSLKSEINSKIEITKQEISNLFKVYFSNKKPQILEKLANEVTRLKYLYKLYEIL